MRPSDVLTADRDPPQILKRSGQNRSTEEFDMRTLVVPGLRKRWPTARIIHELPMRYSTNRIDLAAVTETEIVSVEIKSSRDVIDRLEAQLRAFVPISARMIVALAPKWNAELPALERPTKFGRAFIQQHTEAQAVIQGVSTDIEVWSVDAAAGSVKVTNPGAYRPNKPWLAQMLHMLHVAELTEIAAAHRIAVAKRATHESILADLIDLMQGREVVAAACRALRARDAFDKASDPPIIPTQEAAS